VIARKNRLRTILADKEVSSHIQTPLHKGKKPSVKKVPMTIIRKKEKNPESQYT
jgi:hypothetical protein